MKVLHMNSRGEAGITHFNSWAAKQNTFVQGHVVSVAACWKQLYIIHLQIMCTYNSHNLEPRQSNCLHKNSPEKKWAIENRVEVCENVQGMILSVTVSCHEALSHCWPIHTHRSDREWMTSLFKTIHLLKLANKYLLRTGIIPYIRKI